MTRPAARVSSPFSGKATRGKYRASVFGTRASVCEILLSDRAPDHFPGAFRHRRDTMASEETPTTYLKDYTAYPYDVQHVRLFARPTRLPSFSPDLTLSGSHRRARTPL